MTSFDIRPYLAEAGPCEILAGLTLYRSLLTQIGTKGRKVFRRLSS